MSYKSWITVLQLKTNFSVVLQGVVDSESRLIFIDIGAFVKQSDGGTYCGCNLYHFSEDLETILPKAASFEGSGTEKSLVILGDNGYRLKTYLMNPLARKDLSFEESIYNCRLLRAKRCVVCAFGFVTAE